MTQGHQNLNTSWSTFNKQPGSKRISCQDVFSGESWRLRVSEWKLNCTWSFEECRYSMQVGKVVLYITVREGMKRREGRTKKKGKKEGHFAIFSQIISRNDPYFHGQIIGKRMNWCLSKQYDFFKQLSHSCKIIGFNEIINSCVKPMFKLGYGKNQTFLHWKIISTVFVLNLTFVFNIVMAQCCGTSGSGHTSLQLCCEFQILSSEVLNSDFD